MRVNIYAEEMTNRVKIIEKTIDGIVYTGLRFYLELPVTISGKQIKGPFIHGFNDDDSSAVTFWGKRDLRDLLYKAMDKLNHYYEEPFEKERGSMNGLNKQDLDRYITGNYGED